MGKTTGIPWTHSTFNPWHGCVEVDPACDNCYARSQSKRYGFDVWGPDKPRRFFKTKPHWLEPYKWDEAAGAAVVRERVFIASMCDVFERYKPGVSVSLNPDTKQYEDTALLMDRARGDLWSMISRFRNLDVLLLTKRPQDIRKMVPREWMEHGFPSHVWVGVTIANKAGYWRWHELSKIPAQVRFISYEPALEEISIREMCAIKTVKTMGLGPTYLFPDWFIMGGESGGCGTVRPYNTKTMCEDRVAECRELGIVPFVKQMGAVPLLPEYTVEDVLDKRNPEREWPEGTHFGNRTGLTVLNGRQILLKDRTHGGDMEEWPAHMRVQEFPVPKVVAIR